MKLFIYFILISFAFGTIFFSSSCKKDILMSEGSLTFSADTVMFDTVFTTVGSTTKRFKIYNPSSRPVKISSINLAGGSESKFRFNLDGVSGTNFKDISIPGNDSLFAFVEVTLDPNEGTLPLIIEDSISFITNGKEQNVILAAYGQDAYFHFNDINEGIWANDKPHVIYGFAMVDSATSLTIPAGTKVHLHKNSLLYVRKGQLNVQGNLDNKVIFQGDRLEMFYQDVKGQYYGLYFEEAQPSQINHAIIKNGTAGIHVFSRDVTSQNYTLEIRNTEIYNHSSYGVFNYSGGQIYGENLLIHNNNLYGFFLLEGGGYNFRHCHFLGYGTDGNQPSIAIRNYFTRNDGNTYIGAVNEGSIFNSVIYGTGDNQIAYDTITNNGEVDINFQYTNNLIKLEEELGEVSGFTNNIWNTDPEFKDVSERNFKFSENSILNNSGDPTYSTINDIEGNTRNPNEPDIGAYELH